MPTSPDLEYLQEQQKKMVDSQLWLCCLNCEFWYKKEQGCSYYQATPPLETILIGCSSWTPEIPF